MCLVRTAGLKEQQRKSKKKEEEEEEYPGAEGRREVRMKDDLMVRGELRPVNAPHLDWQLGLGIIIDNSAGRRTEEGARRGLV